MKKTVLINGIKCDLKSSAAIPRIYRLKFNRDIFKDMMRIQNQVELQEKINRERAAEAEKEGKKLDPDEFESQLPIESLEMFENVAYLMHKHGDPSQPDSIEEWLEQFETFDIYQILPEILELWNIENNQMSAPKKKTGK